jgi:GAF domain
LLQELVKAAYQSPTGRLLSAKGQAAVRQGGHLASFVRVSLDEPKAMQHMHGAAEDLRDASRLDVLLPKILDGAMSLTGVDFGNVQLLDPLSGALRIVTQSGFGSEFTDYFTVVDDDHSACGRAARQCAQTVIADVTTDPGFAPHREIAAAAGFRAVQSTPLADSAGRLIGMVSTHFRQPGRPADRDLRSLELFGDIAGEAVARHLDLPGDTAWPQAVEERDGSRLQPPDQLSPPETTVLAEFADHIVYRLFAAGLSLASAQALVGDGAAGDRVAAAVEELDRAIRAIRDIRATVVDLADRRQLLPTPPRPLPPRP